jgi:hypothetical protein
MWLARILGRVTWAETAAPGSSRSGSRNLRFKTSLTGSAMPGNLHSWRTVEVSGKITISE